jgi:hypothetical protein
MKNQGEKGHQSVLRDGKPNRKALALQVGEGGGVVAWVELYSQ